MRRQPMYLAPLVAILALMAGDRLRAAPPPSVPPDLTQGNTVDRERTYNLGATGLRAGFIPGPPTSLRAARAAPRRPAGRSWSRTSGQSRRRTACMQVDDVILGAGGKLSPTTPARASLWRSRKPKRNPTAAS